MQAILYERYGLPEVLQIKEVEKPAPKANEIRVKVHATPVNYGDLAARNFKQIRLRDFNMPAFFLLPSKLYFGLSKPRIRILGSEFAGTVETIGKTVSKFKPGDEVFGYLGQKMGAYAEYVCMPETGIVGLKPSSMSFTEAACVPYGGIMAMSHLEKVDIQKGQKVLINGASGGIGSVALQLAKHYGAEVTAVCGTPRLDYVRALGAARVIDYTREDFTRNGETYDVIYDILGRSSFSRCKASLSENGRYLLASFKTGKLLQMLRTSIIGKKKVICAMAGEKQEDLAVLKEIAEAGKLKTLIDKRFRMEEAAEAHRYSETGQKKGHVVITTETNP